MGKHILEPSCPKLEIAKTKITHTLETNAFQGKQYRAWVNSIPYFTNLANQYNYDALKFLLMQMVKDSVYAIERNAKHYGTVLGAQTATGTKKTVQSTRIYMTSKGSFIRVNDATIEQEFGRRKTKMLRLIKHILKETILTENEANSLRRIIDNLEISFRQIMNTRLVNLEVYLAQLRISKKSKKKSASSTVYKPHPFPLLEEKEAGFTPEMKSLIAEFHCCGRKKVYTTAKAAESTEAFKSDKQLDAYLCTFCTGYHLGHGQADVDYTKIVSSEYKPGNHTTWLRYPDKVETFLKEKGVTL